MDPYNTSAEYLRVRVEQMAQDMSQKFQTQAAAGGQLQPFFICDIVNGVENAVGGIVNAAHDAVNAAVNAAHDAVNAVENIGERAVTATEAIVHAVTVHTQQIVHITNIATDVVKTATFITEFVGGVLPQEEKGTHASHAASTAAASASAAELIQARRTAIMQHRASITNDVLAKRVELQAKIAGVRAKASSSPRTS
jgi:hypothetical protein